MLIVSNILSFSLLYFPFLLFFLSINCSFHLFIYLFLLICSSCPLSISLTLSISFSPSSPLSLLTPITLSPHSLICYCPLKGKSLTPPPLPRKSRSHHGYCTHLKSVPEELAEAGFTSPVVQHLKCELDRTLPWHDFPRLKHFLAWNCRQTGFHFSVLHSPWCCPANPLMSLFCLFVCLLCPCLC